MELTLPAPSFKYEYDLDSLLLVRPRGHDFEMYVTPRYVHSYQNCEYERYTARLLSQLAGGCSLFIDVGASYGFYTLLLATEHPDLEILALEPVAETFKALTLSAARLAGGLVQLYQSAASDADGAAPFHISIAADSCGFSPHPVAPPLRRVEVPTTRLDTLLASKLPQPTLIKIDVEGHEPAVLRGLAETLARFPEVRLVLEFNPKMLESAETDPESLLRELEHLGFAIFLLDDERGLPRRLKHIAEWKQWFGKLSYANLYCVRNESALSSCFFSHSSLLTGAEQSLVQLVKELVADHGVVCSAVLPGSGPLEEALTRVGAACLTADYGWWAEMPQNGSAPPALSELQPHLSGLLASLLPILAEIDPDLIWTQTMVIPWGACLASLLGKPHIWSVCEYGELDHGLRFFAPLPRVLEDILASSARVYTCGQLLGQTLFPAADHWRTLHRNVEIPPLPLDRNGTDWDQEPGALRLAVFATLQESKGQEDAVRAVAELLGEGRKIQLLLAGYAEPRYRLTLESLIASLNLKDNVRMPGFVADRLTAMQEADIILICSRREAFGRVGVEAMLMGKPVVYAAAGGLLEYMIDGRTGISYPPGDAAALACVLRRLQDDPQARAKLGTEGQNYARTRFTRDKYGGEVYRDLLAIKAQWTAGATLPALLRPLLISEVSHAEQEVVRLSGQLAAALLELTKTREQLATVEKAQSEQVGPLKALERSFRRRRKRLAARTGTSLGWLWRHFSAYQALSRTADREVTTGERLRYFLPWATSLKPGRSPFRDRNIWIVFAARAFLDRKLSAGMKIFEFGMGGSTLYFLRKGCAVWSVEHNPEWFATVSAEVDRNHHPDWQRFLHLPQSEPPPGREPNSLAEYRSEMEAYRGQTFRNYACQIDQFPDRHFDIVLIDGRARAGCFRQAYPKVKQGGLLILDNSERARYRSIHEVVQRMAWKKHDFFGPGPYVQKEFWGTTIWIRTD